MPRVRERKTRNGIYTNPNVFNNAYQAVCEGRVSVRGAAGRFGVPVTTLQRFIKNKKENRGTPQPGYKPHNRVFTVQQEDILRDYLLRASEIYFGLSPHEVRRLAYQLAKKNNCTYPVTWDANQTAGKDWFSAFLLRNPQLSIHCPQATSLSRATSFNPTNVRNFFSNLSKVLDKHNFQAKDIWNVDETSTVTAQVLDKIAAGRSTKQVGAMTSAERGELVTMALAVNAMGNYIPPHFVFPGKVLHDHFVRDGPTGCMGSCSGSGWMQESDFVLFLKHFVRYTRASPASRVLLLLDNHVSHLSLEGIDYCRANGVVLLSFPPHCSHKLQPLDRSVYDPLKRDLNSAMDRWMMVNPGKTMTIYDLPGIVATALPSAATPSNIMAGFRCTGIWPFNPTIFTERDFSPAYVTNRPVPLPTDVAPAARAESPESWSTDDDDTVGPAPLGPAPSAPHQSPTSPAIASSSSAAEAFSPETIQDPTEQIDTVIQSECKMERLCWFEMPIGFIGAGNMAFGMTQGILTSGRVNPANVKVSAPSSNNLGRFQEMGVAITHSNTEVVASSHLVFLAVKPHLVPVVLQEIAHLVTQEHIIVSIAAGVTIATVEALLPPDSVVVRLMPNLPCMVQEGALLFACGSRARVEHGVLLRDLLAPCGLVEEGPESWIDPYTGMSGGVAFVYLFAEALAEGGLKMGMPSALAHRIAAQTVLGAGRLLRDCGKHPAQLRAEVCTPGGTTIFGLHELERGGLRAAVMGAVEAATERARELGRK